MADVSIVPVDAAQGELARRAYRRDDKCRDAAALDCGDCFAYASAKSLNERLLFKGRDFELTEVVPAIA